MAMEDDLLAPEHRQLELELRCLTRHTTKSQSRTRTVLCTPVAPKLHAARYSPSTSEPASYSAVSARGVYVLEKKTL